MTAWDYRNRAWVALSGKWGILALITLIEVAITGVLSETAVGTLIVTGPFAVALAMISLNVLRGNWVSVENLFDGFKNFLNTFLLGLLNSLFIFLWSLLFIIPGIVKELSYSMSYYIMAENPCISQSEARFQSMLMMDGHKWELFCLRFSFIGWILLCILTLGIASFWVIPYMNTATAAFYEDIKTRM